MADDDQQPPPERMVDPPDEHTFLGSAYDASLVMETTPIVRWVPGGPEPLEQRSAYDANLMIDTTPPSRWEPAAESGATGDSASAGGSAADD